MAKYELDTVEDFLEEMRVASAESVGISIRLSIGEAGPNNKNLIGAILLTSVSGDNGFSHQEIVANEVVPLEDETSQKGVVIALEKRRDMIVKLFQDRYPKCRIFKGRVLK